MKKLFLTLMLSGVFILQGLSQNWQLYWSDEFNTNSLDLNNWEVVVGNGCPDLCGFGNNELQYYTDRRENLHIENGKLIIEARAEPYQNANYTSGKLVTANKVDFVYGRVEAMMKLPEGQGIWPAFWMLPADNVYGGWPQSGEIDIMELVGHEPSTSHGTIHYGDPWPNNRWTGGSYILSGARFSEGFHQFAVEWGPDVIRWYVDSILFSTKTPQDVAPKNWPFDQDFYLILNCAVGGNWPGSPDSTSVFPQTMEIEYIRVYQDVPTHAISRMEDGTDLPLVYPNPVTDLLRLDLKQSEGPINISIYNQLGQEVIRTAVTRREKNNLQEIDVSSLVAGVYFVSITTGNRRFRIQILLDPSF